jgi:hypothetical protein
MTGWTWMDLEVAWDIIQVYPLMRIGLLTMIWMNGVTHWIQGKTVAQSFSTLLKMLDISLKKSLVLQRFLMTLDNPSNHRHGGTS